METTRIRTDPDQYRSKIAAEKVKNECQMCRVFGCRSYREGLSRYCSTHANRAGKTGSPTVKPIDDLLSLAKPSLKLAGEIRRKELPALENILLAKVAHVIPRSQEYVYTWQGRIESGLKLSEKAQIVLATARHKATQERVIALTILWAIAKELDEQTFTSTKERVQFFRTALGNQVVHYADISKTWFENKKHWRTESCYYADEGPKMIVVKEERIRHREKQLITGAVKRKAGALLLDALFKELGPTKSWMNDAWAQPYLGYIKERLASAGARHYDN